MKLQDVIATVGGTMQMVIVIFFIFVMPFVDISYKSAFTNEYMSERFFQEECLENLKKLVELDDKNHNNVVSKKMIMDTNAVTSKAPDDSDENQATNN